MPKLMMIQPGAFGDLLMCMPIAKWYAVNGYEIYWPVRSHFLPLLKYLDYVIPIELDDRVLDSDWMKSDVMKCLEVQSDFDYVLNLADRGPHSTAQLFDEKVDVCKYRLADVPFEQRYNLEWSRNLEKECQLQIDIFGITLDDNSADSIKIDEYILGALQFSNGKVDWPTEAVNSQFKLIEMDKRDEYTIFDWYPIILNASSIFAIESGFGAFIDGIVYELDCPLHLLYRTPGYLWNKSEHWIID